jgi:SAM-dependent methyltransferase
MSPINDIQEFTSIITDALNSKTFSRLIISKKRKKNEELRSVIIKPVKIKAGNMLNFVFRYPTKDITKNNVYSEGLKTIEELLFSTFLQAELFTTLHHYHLLINKKGMIKLSTKKANNEVTAEESHDKIKKRFIATDKNIYLKQLGIVTADYKVKTAKQDKYRQINKYIEIIDGIIRNTNVKSPFYVSDMGSGKGYLTFALYDYLAHKQKLNVHVSGIEYRQELVSKCNSIAKEAKFNQLKFIQGTIEDTTIENLDMLIALHACDTATDDAIYRGIKENAQIIICAPCCHKQIRKELKPENELGLIAQYGILKERQAEILTDTIRSQILEAFGYKTKVFEFISTEHTPKNVMIVGVKKKDSPTPNEALLDGVRTIKNMHGIERHYLETLLDINP